LTFTSDSQCHECGRSARRIALAPKAHQSHRPHPKRTRTSAFTQSRIEAVPDSNDDIETRVSGLEREVARLREQAALTRSDAAGARVLAAGADRDVSEVRAELRAHTQGLNALRETQLEQGRAIAGLRTDFAGQGRAIAGLREDLAAQGQQMTEGFATVNTGMTQITVLLTRIADSSED
jgi:hypothetical protein